MSRTRKGGLWKLFRENTKTFLNVAFGMTLDSVDQILAGMFYLILKVLTISCNILVNSFS